MPATEEVHVRLLVAREPKPQRLRLAGLAGELTHLDQDDRAPHDGRPLAPVALAYAPRLGMQTRPSPHPHRAVVFVLVAALGRRRSPGLGVWQGELAAVAAWAPHRPRLQFFRGGVERAVG